MITRKLRKLSSRAGQSAVEFAFASVFFFLLILALFDLGRVCYQWSIAQFAVNEAARTGILNGDTDALTATYNSIATPLGLPATTPANWSITDLTGAAVQNPMPMNSYFQLNMTAPVRLTILGALYAAMGFQSNTINVTVRTIIRNEPY